MPAKASSSDAIDLATRLIERTALVLFDIDGPSAAKRLGKCDANASRFSCITQGHRHRQITKHGVHESLRFKLEGIRKPLIKSRRAFAAHALGIGYLHTVESRVLSNRQATARTDNLGQRFVPVCHGARRIEAGDLPVA